MKRVLVLIITILLFLLNLGGCASIVDSDIRYDIDIELIKETLSISQDIHYKNTSDEPLDTITLVSHVGAYTSQGNVVSASRVEAYPFGQNYAMLDIDSVSLNGEPCEYDRVDEMYITISLDRALKPNKSLDISVNYRETLPKNRLRYGYNDTSINIGNAFFSVLPMDSERYPFAMNGDPFFHEIADYNVTLKCDSRYSIACTGGASVTRSGDKVIYESSQCNVRDYAIVLSDSMHFVGDRTNGIDIYYVARKSSHLVNIRVARRAIEIFGDIYGEYPYDTLYVVENDVAFGGMEYPGIVYVSEWLDAANMEHTIIHEIAHQWWYGIVGVNENVDYFVDEGMAELSTILYYIYNGEDRYARALVKMMRDDYIRMNIDRTREERMALPLHNISDDDYYRIAYLKAPLVLYNAMNRMGRAEFLNRISEVIERYSYDNITTSEFLDIVGLGDEKKYIDGAYLDV